MSRVQAVTEDIQFVVKTASFTPLPTSHLIKEFGKWIEQQAKENNFLVWRCSIEGSAQDYN